MSSMSVQMPFRRGTPERLGRRLYRKTVLPVNQSIEYEGEPLHFTPDYLAELVKGFNAGAFEQVPFLLADAQNRHHSDPSKYRGSVLGLEMTEHGLDALIELTEDGAKLIEDNPNLGVSARIVPDLKRPDGSQHKLALAHVLGTLDPKLHGLGPWAEAELSHPTDAVVDLTSARFSDDQPKEAAMAELSDEAIERLNKLTPEQWDRLMAGDPPSTDPEPTGTDDDAEFDETYRQMLAESGIDPDDEAAIAALLADEGDPATNGNEAEPAALSAEQAAAIELANMRSQQTATDLSVVQAQLADAHWQEERKALIYQGIPPAAVELAEPFLRSSGVIELSAGNVESEHDRALKLLSMLKGSVDLAGETQSAQPPSEDDERQRILDQWKRQYPMPGDRQIAGVQGGNA